MPYKDYEKQKENSRQNYYLNRERKLAGVKKLYYANWEAMQEKRDKWLKENPEKYKAARHKYMKKYLADPENKQKTRARRKVQTAMVNGTIIKPITCSECGINGSIEAHHYKGYSDEFAIDVVWLCKICHEAEHHRLFNSKDLRSAIAKK